MRRGGAHVTPSGESHVGHEANLKARTRKTDVSSLFHPPSQRPGILNVKCVFFFFIVIGRSSVGDCRPKPPNAINLNATPPQDPHEAFIMQEWTASRKLETETQKMCERVSNYSPRSACDPALQYLVGLNPLLPWLKLSSAYKTSQRLCKPSFKLYKLSWEATFSE